MDVPIFPLNGAVLFPGTSLPLNIFENRYLEMVDYALANNRYIGMIQSDTNKKLYKVGCIGKIHSFNETSDGRYLISLQGTNSFKLISELKSEYNFKLVKAELIDENKSKFNSLEGRDKKMIIDKYKEYIKIKNINLDMSEIENIELEQIIKFIAMVSPFKNEEKQILLETSNLNEFYDKLKSIIELEIVDRDITKTIN